MKFRLAIFLVLALSLFMTGCRGDANANANANAAAPTPITKTTESAVVDPAMKAKVEDALRAKGFTDVSVDTSTGETILRGSVNQGKMTEAVMVAQEAAGKPVKNQLTEK
jgi:osmotically-inducible protein OsmY